MSVDSMIWNSFRILYTIFYLKSILFEKITKKALTIDGSCNIYDKKNILKDKIIVKIATI